VPERRGEWIVFVLALCALGVIVALIVLKETHTAVPFVHAEDSSAVTTRGFATTANTITTPRGESRAKPSSAQLVLTASRGDSWIAVRAGSAHGTVLFQGTLSEGHARTFIDPVLWVRFGDASNVDARLNGQPLSLPAGTVSIVITPQGLG
jgi:Domain of unknown function (DUF4115)